MVCCSVYTRTRSPAAHRPRRQSRPGWSLDYCIIRRAQASEAGVSLHRNALRLTVRRSLGQCQSERDKFRMKGEVGLRRWCLWLWRSWVAEMVLVVGVHERNSTVQFIYMHEMNWTYQLESDRARATETGTEALTCRQLWLPRD